MEIYDRRQHGKLFKRNSNLEECRLVKVAFMGAAYSGKSAIVQRLVTGKFFEDVYDPTVFDFHEFESIVDNTYRLCFQISDTAGEFSFPAMDRLTIQKVDIVVVVFDMTSSRSLKRCEELMKKIKEINPKKSIMVIGNKTDLPHRILPKRNLELRLSSNHEHTYFETSAKLDKNAGHELIKRISEEFAISRGPFDVKQSRKPISAKLKRKFAESTENLLDLF